MAAKSLVFWMNDIGQICSRVFLIPENIFDVNVFDLTYNGVMIIKCLFNNVKACLL